MPASSKASSNSRVCSVGPSSSVKAIVFGTIHYNHKIYYILLNYNLLLLSTRL